MTSRLIINIYGLLCVALAGCVTTGKTVTQDNTAAEKLIHEIGILNDSVPDTFSSRCFIRTTAGGKFYKSPGTLYYSHQPLAVKLKMTDPIFRSVLAEILLSDNILRMHIPIEQKLFIRKADPLSAVTPDFNPEFISKTALGRVPVLDGYTIVSATTSGENPGDRKDTLVLENQLYRETITLEKSIPNQVTIESRDGSDSFKIEYSSPVRIDTYFFFKKIYARSKNSGNDFMIEYSDLKINPSFDREKIFSITVPSGTETVE